MKNCSETALKIAFFSMKLKIEIEKFIKLNGMSTISNCRVARLLWNCSETALDSFSPLEKWKIALKSLWNCSAIFLSIELNGMTSFWWLHLMTALKLLWNCSETALLFSYRLNWMVWRDFDDLIRWRWFITGGGSIELDNLSPQVAVNWSGWPLPPQRGPAINKNGNRLDWIELKWCRNDVEMTSEWRLIDVHLRAGAQTFPPQHLWILIAR